MTKSVNELRVITKKPIEASEEEIKKNQRARSARLRIVEKVMMV
jgi:16S rRNA (cytosine1402-N4)-methyltransferase